MRDLRGIEKLGEYKKIPVTVDWSYLNQEVGFRKEEEKFERALARFLILGSITFYIVVTIFSLLNGQFIWLTIFWIDSFVKLLIWFVLMIILYSFYLSRNRNIFLDRIHYRKLIDLIKRVESDETVKGIELTSYFDHNVLNIIDEMLNDYQDNFLPQLMTEILEYQFVRNAIQRLGLTVAEYEAIRDKFSKLENIHVSFWIRPLLIEAFFIAFTNKFDYVGEMSIFLWLCKKPLIKTLQEYNVGKNELESLEMWVSNTIRKKRYLTTFMEKSSLKPVSTLNRAYTSRFSPTLVKYSRDFTAEVARGDFTMSIARDLELAKLIESIQKGESSATLIIGEHGVGKTTLLKSLAVKMVVEEVPPILQDMRLVSFDFNRAYALSPNIEKFKSTVENVLEEAAGTKNIVLVIDDIDDLVDIRKEIAAEVVNLVTKALDVYKIRVVATSTPEGFTKYISNYKSLTSLFSNVYMNEPADNIALQILMDELPKLESKFHVSVSFDTLVQIAKLSHTFEFDRVLPDKGILLLEEAMVKAQTEKLNFVTEKLIEEIVSAKVGVKIGAIKSNEAEVLLNLEKELHKRIIGQDVAVTAVASALRRSRAGLTSDKRPIASFLFFGPTGVGKTEVAKAVTDLYYGAEAEMIRVDMSEYQEEANLKRLIGDPQGGEFEGGYLTDAVRRKPYSLILLDEIEKANPKVLDLFLQVLDEGRITDGMGRKISFINTIIIATSNVASQKIADLLEQQKTYEQVQEEVLPEIRKYLRVEFINRFDRVVMFKPLNQEEVTAIAALSLKSEEKKLAEKNIELHFGLLVAEEVAKLGYNPVYGARELRRVIQDTVQDKIAELLIAGKIKGGSIIQINSLAELEEK
ncbi:MAG: ATP-dependent Clp protease ATP-binding subunit [bacterium]